MDIATATVNEDTLQTISLPWIPGVSPKLRKIYRKADYKVVFKSNRNLRTTLTAKNKTALPKNSHPGVYKIPCSCGKTPYRGETKMRVSTRSTQHEDSIKKERWIIQEFAHTLRIAIGEIKFQGTETVNVIYNRFDRKVREALEIQMNGCHIRDGGMNLDDGQYVNTKFWTPFFKDIRKNKVDVN